MKLTDREGAPWVLDNIRSAIEANGLCPEPASKPTGDSTKEYNRSNPQHLARGDAAPTRGGWETGVKVEATLGMEGGWAGNHRRDAGAGEARRSPDVIRQEILGIYTLSEDSDDDEVSTRDNRAGQEVAGADAGAKAVEAGHRRVGECTAQELAWGRITPGAIELANTFRPQVTRRGKCRSSLRLGKYRVLLNFARMIPTSYSSFEQAASRLASVHRARGRFGPTESRSSLLLLQVQGLHPGLKEDRDSSALMFRLLRNLLVVSRLHVPRLNNRGIGIFENPLPLFDSVTP